VGLPHKGYQKAGFLAETKFGKGCGTGRPSLKLCKENESRTQADTQQLAPQTRNRLGHTITLQLFGAQLLLALALVLGAGWDNTGNPDVPIHEHGTETPPKCSWQH
jgi:hypothetical protein